jgi:ATP-binding cassette subfamily B protein
MALIAIPIILAFVRRYSSEIRSFTAAQRRREGAMASLFHEALGSTRLSRVFNRDSSVRSRFEEESAVSLELGMEASLKEERFTWAVEVLGAFLTGLVLIAAVYRAQAGAMSEGELFLCFFYIRGFYRPIRTGVKQASRIWRTLAQAERVIELLDMEHGVKEAKGARPAPVLQGEIEFREVTFRYTPEQALMEKLNLKLRAKRVTAIVGPTGAGKTTLVSMVPRLYDPDEGSILIDGQDIREFTLESLRDQISVVLQESTLLFASVAENIAYGRPNATIQEIEAAAWSAGAHDFIKDLPQGYNTEIGERGETLSGGQRQLIAIARAMIRDAPIIILDEPMTGLDAASAAQVLDGIERLIVDKTVLFITHNLGLVESADEVVVINDGKVVQQGTPAELRESEGLYRDLFRAQFETDGVLTASR